MVCGGFSCSRNALVALNTLYILIALLLIILPAVAKGQAYVSSLYAVGGIIACGIFLLFVSILGLIGAIRHHQVCLFFYMIILFLIFLLEISVSIVCLAVNDKKIEDLVQKSWNTSSIETRKDIQRALCCCQFDPDDLNIACPPEISENCVLPSAVPTAGYSPDGYPYCEDELFSVWKHGLNYCGGLGLFFSFTELAGVLLAFRFRYIKDPRANPNAFL